MNSQLIGLITSLIAALTTGVSGYFLFKTRKKVEVKFRQIERSEELKWKYSTPLLKSAEELYNKINDFVRNKDSSLGFLLKNLDDKFEKISSVSDLISTPEAIYQSITLYQFARFFANVEAIKNDIGLLELASNKQTMTFQILLHQATTVFSSGRLHNKFKIKESNLLKYQGRIIQGSQTLMAEALFKKEKEHEKECISYYEFCKRFADNDDIKVCFKPLISFLSDLNDIEYDNYLTSTEIDFRWVKVITFAHFLRKLIRFMDIANAITEGVPNVWTDLGVK